MRKAPGPASRRSESAEFSGRVGAIVAEGCQPSITSVASSLAPITAAQIGFVGLDPAQPITVQYTGPGGFGAGLALFDIGRSAVDVLEDLGSLYVNTTYGGDPAAIQRDLDNLARHRLDLLNNSVSAASFGLVNVVPANTPGALNLAGFAFTSNAVDLVASGVEAAMEAVTRDTSGRMRNPFPPNKGFGRIVGGTTNMPPDGSIHLCCVTGSEIECMPDEGGSYSLVVPLDVPGTNYGSMTVKIQEVISGTNRGSLNVNLTNLPAFREIPVQTITVTRDCYAEYEACVNAWPGRLERLS